MTKNKVWLIFYDLLRTSTLIQGTMALGSTATIAYLYLTHSIVPDDLKTIVMLILGYYFGTKTQQRENEELYKDVAKSRTGINGGAN